MQDLTKDLYEEHGYESFVYCPVGFVAEHLEVLYDNDYECKVVTDELMPNISDQICRMHNLHLSTVWLKLFPKSEGNS